MEINLSEGIYPFDSKFAVKFLESPDEWNDLPELLNFNSLIKPQNEVFR